MIFRDINSFVKELVRLKQVAFIDAPVDPKLELAEIHRRVIQEGGPALLFKNPKGSSFPVVTNLFGTKERAQMAFGKNGEQFIKDVASLPHELLPPSIQALWGKRSFFGKALKVGIKNHSTHSFVTETPPKLSKLPILTTWPMDGGPFITLPLVYTEHPETGMHNLGMYRIQRFSDTTTGLHMQIGKGGGFHLSKAKELGKKLPVNIFVGGPPAAILAAIAPLPENVPELLLASLLLGEKLSLAKNTSGPLPLLRDAEFCLVGSVTPGEMHPEGPFGDHYGYYSLEHDFPLFRCDALLHKKDAIYPATVVGKPRQEDFFIGDILQDILSPLFPLVMPAVKSLWSYGETGYHSLAAAVVQERYKREAMVSGFRILGEGQLSLTKFLLLTDGALDLTDFRSVLTYILERADFRSDLYIFSNLSMDTLDYAGPALNEGSKGILLGMGEKIRDLTGDFSGDIPYGIRDVKVFSPGCLVVSGHGFEHDRELPQRVASHKSFSKFPLIVLCDNAEIAAHTTESFLWTTFTRFEPAADIYGKEVALKRFHPSLTPPVVIDARMKPHYPPEVECDDETKALVDKRWREYFPK